jgi:hypothetical protein
MTGSGHSRRYCHVRSLVRYPQRRTLPRPIETRLLVAFLRPICKQRAQPPRLLRLASLDLATRDARTVTKDSAYRLQRTCGNLLPGCLVWFFVRSQFGEGSRRDGEEGTADRARAGHRRSGPRRRTASRGCDRTSRADHPHPSPSKRLPGRPASACEPRAAATAAITCAHSPNASKSTPKNFASWGRRACSCARSSPLQA